MIDEIANILQTDPIVKNLRRLGPTAPLFRYVSLYVSSLQPRLFEGIHVRKVPYASRPFSDDQGYKYPMEVLSSALVPGLLAYDTYCNKRPLIFKKGWLSFSRHVFQDIDNKLFRLFEIINGAISSTSGIGENNERDLSTIKDKISKDINAMIKGQENINNHSFWRLCGMYYFTKQNNTIYLPDPDNYQCFVEYSSTNLTKLVNSIRTTLRGFIVANKAGNSKFQQAVKYKGHSESQKYYPAFIFSHAHNIRIQNFRAIVDGSAKHEQIPELILPSLRQQPRNRQIKTMYYLQLDLLAYSMKIESWENLIYYNIQRSQLEYLPAKVAAAFFILGSMSMVFNDYKMFSGFDDETKNQVLEMVQHYCNCNIHTFMRSIYGFNGQLTTNARTILDAITIARKSAAGNTIDVSSIMLHNRGNSIFNDEDTLKKIGL